MIYFFYTIHVLVSLFLILVVLLQQGKGADLSVFGGGATQAAFGARGAATLLHKLTVGGFVAFILTTLVIGFLESSASTSSVMSGADVATEAPAAPLEPADPFELTGDDDAEPIPEGGLLDEAAEEPPAETTDGPEG